MGAQLVLCVGMHRSGTSLTASLLQAIGLPLPGDLIGADVANPSGYFENRSVVDAQEQLLRELGFWWPTEEASRGLPAAVQRQPAYRAHVDWLTRYLDGLLQAQGPRLAIKDPRTSLLLPAWREAADRLGANLKLVICLRQPRDVCWSLVWRDGPSVGMGWSRSQRLWLEHYRALLVDGQGLPAQVAVYERWLEPDQAQHQLREFAGFLALEASDAAISAALERIRPEFNHGGNHLPPVDRSLRRLHTALSNRETRAARWPRAASRAARSLRRHQRWDAAWLRLRLLWVRQQLGPALDAGTLRKQVGSTSLRRYRQQFATHPDLRPHPLISPAHLNQERQRCGLPPLRRADDLFRHLLNPDLIPLNPHPWFDARAYQQRSGSLGSSGEHPVLTYLRRNRRGQITPLPHPSWLRSLGANRPTGELHPLPPFLQALRPGLVLADPITSLGDPASGEHAVIEAHEAYWQAIEQAFSLWPGDDRLGPLTWLAGQAGVELLGCAGSSPAQGMACWWMPGDWPAPLLAGLAGADPSLSRGFADPEAVVQGLDEHSADAAPVLLALTPALLARLLAEQRRLPPGVAVLNLTWPAAAEQSAWLHLLAGAATVLECRPAVRAYLLALGLRAQWCTPSAAAPPDTTDRQPQLLLAFAGGPAEALLARRAEQLDPERYSAYLRLDAQFLSLGSTAEAPVRWLNGMKQRHGRWVWLTGPPAPDDLQAWAVLAWAQHHSVPLTLLKESDLAAQTWLTNLMGTEATA